jgi:hypothetical protein
MLEEEVRSNGGSLMKGLYVGVLICLMMGALLPSPVGATSMNAIAGVVTHAIYGVPLDGVEISFEDLSNSEVEYEQTNQDGEYSLALNDFSSWSWGDIIKILISEVGFSCYWTIVTLDANIPTQMDLDIKMYPASQGQYGIDNEWNDPFMLMELNCQGDADDLTGGAWYGDPNGHHHDNNAQEKVGAQYDGVELTAGCRIQDNANWVPYDQENQRWRTMKITVYTTMTVSERNWPHYQYYHDTIYIEYNDENYYTITHGESVTIDPYHDVWLNKDDWGSMPNVRPGINNRALDIEDHLFWDIDDITDGDDPQYPVHYFPNSYGAAEWWDIDHLYFTYYWD